MTIDIDADEDTSRGGLWVALLIVAAACFASGYSAGYLRGFDAAATRAHEQREALIRAPSPPGHAEKGPIAEP